jgi:hypothetical protein
MTEIVVGIDGRLDVSGDHASDRDAGERRDHGGAGDAPLADRLDHRDLDVGQVEAETGTDEGHERGRRPPRGSR